MPPAIAAAVYGAVILGLFALDRDREARVSLALWIPVVWTSIGASRSVSEWSAGVTPLLKNPDEFIDGNALDRNLLAGLVAIALMVLFVRGKRTGATLRANGPILVFFLYGALSMFWSDFPDVTFKRLIKAFGNVLMVMIVLTDRNPGEAVKKLLARIGFLLIPLSVLLIKYFPQYGRGFSTLEWKAYNIGVSTDKNDLGAIALVFGLASVWRLIAAIRSEERPRRVGPLIAHGFLVAMTLYLFQLASSATSFVCFVLGVFLIGVMNLRSFEGRPAAIHVFMAAATVVAVLAVSLGVSDIFFGALGRETTLTGRTGLWQDLLQMDVNPWFGTGFESFWLGDRAKSLWQVYWWHPNQAHNGYLETYLNLGWLGVALFGVIAIWGYFNVTDTFSRYSDMGRLRLAFFVVALLYNTTEASFKVMHPVWITFLLAVAVIPETRPRQPKRRVAGMTNAAVKVSESSSVRRLHALRSHHVEIFDRHGQRP